MADAAPSCSPDRRCHAGSHPASRRISVVAAPGQIKFGERCASPASQVGYRRCPFDGMSPGTTRRVGYTAHHETPQPASRPRGASAPVGSTHSANPRAIPPNGAPQATREARHPRGAIADQGICRREDALQKVGAGDAHIPAALFRPLLAIATLHDRGQVELLIVDSEPHAAEQIDGYLPLRVKRGDRRGNKHDSLAVVASGGKLLASPR